MGLAKSSLDKTLLSSYILEAHAWFKCQTLIWLLENFCYGDRLPLTDHKAVPQMKIGKAVAKERKCRTHKTSFSQPLVLQPLLALTFFKPVHVPIVTYLLITLFSDLRC